MAKFCHNCGTSLADDAAFCPSCGAQQVQAQQPPQQAAPRQPAPAPSPKKPRKTGLIAGIAAACVVAALALVFVFVIYPNLSADPDNYETYLREGESALDAEAYADARDAYSHAIDLDDSRAEAYIGRGDAYAGLEKFEDALADYETACELDDQDADLYLKMVDLCIRMGDDAHAQELLERGIDALGGNETLETRLAELTGGGASLSTDPQNGGQTGDVDLPGGSQPVSGTVSLSASVEQALSNTADALAATLEQSPYSAIADFTAALADGQVTMLLEAHDSQNDASVGLHWNGNLDDQEIAASIGVNMNGETADLDLYINDEYGAFHSDLIDSQWYGATWATLPQDLSDSILYEAGIVSASDISNLNTLYEQIFQLVDQLNTGSFDLSTLDLNRYAAILSSASVSTSSGTDSAGRDYETMSIPYASVADVVSELAETLANDAAAFELLAPIFEANGDTVTESDWRDALTDFAADLQATAEEIDGVCDLTVYLANNRLDSITVDLALTDGAQTLASSFVLSIEYTGEYLTRFDISLYLEVPNEQPLDFGITFEAAPEDSYYADRCALRITSGGETASVSLENTWDRSADSVTTTLSVIDGGTEQRQSFSYSLSQSRSSTQLQLDLTALFGIDSQVTVIAIPGGASITRPDRFVNLDAWDQAFLDKLEAAAGQLNSLLSGGTATADDYAFAPDATNDTVTAFIG